MSSMVAVVGRPNVGKSTLVNRLAGKREAITDTFAGVTRDRKVVPAEWTGRSFELVDTGGWTLTEGGIEAEVSRQAAIAAGFADVIVFVVDATVGLTDEDEAAASLVRRSEVPVLVVANKVDSDRQEAEAWEAARLGMGEVHLVSALHGRGSGDLLDAIVAALPPEDLSGDEAGRCDFDDGTRVAFSEERVAIVGRPNVGKSTLFNRLAGEERSVVHDEPGTTRDSIDTLVDTPEGRLRFVDTAGMRRKGHQAEGAEYYSVVRALASIDRADVSLLVIDATAGVTHQDQRLAERVDAAGSPVVLVLNKWELLDAEARATVTADLEDRLAFLAYAPVVKLSALTGKGVHKLLPALKQAVTAYHRRLPTHEVNRVLASAQASSPPPRGARILYATQGAVDPPTFTLFVNRPLPATYMRYLERSLRESFDLGPTPLKLRVRRR